MSAKHTHTTAAPAEAAVIQDYDVDGTLAMFDVSVSEMNRVLDMMEREMAEMAITTTLAMAQALRMLRDAPPRSNKNTSTVSPPTADHSAS